MMLSQAGRRLLMAAGLTGGLSYGLLREQQPVRCGGRAADVDELRARVAAISRQLDGASTGQSTYTGADFKDELRAGIPKLGLFVNSGSPVIAGQLSHMGYDWLLVDAQHGGSNHVALGQMLTAISNGRAKSMVRVGGFDDRAGIQQALDAGADGVLVPYINTAEEARQAVSCCRYPTAGTRSVYFPQPCMNKDGLLGYAGASGRNVIVAMQVETADCVKNLEEIAAVEGVDVLFLGQNDLCMSMGLYEKYEFPHMYTSPELAEATKKLLRLCKRHDIIPGIFLFGPDKVAEFRAKGFNFVSVGNDLHHVLMYGTTCITTVKGALGGEWAPLPSSIVQS